MVIVVFITVMLSVYVGVQMRTPTYEASVKMLVTGKMPKGLEYQELVGSGSLTTTHMELVKSKKVIERAVMALRLYERPLDYEKRYASWLKRILIEKKVKRVKEELDKMSPDRRRIFYFNRAVSILTNSISTQKMGEQSSIFLITAKDFNPQEAIKMANVVSRSYVIFDLETQIAELNLIYGEMNPTIQKLRSFIDKLKDSLDGRLLSDLEALGPASVKIISQAESAHPVRTRGKLNLYIVGFIFSIISSIVLAFGLEYIDQTIKGPKDVDRFFQIPFIGSIPKRKKKDILIMNTSAGADKLECVKAFQRVGDKISIFLKEQNIKSVLVNSLTRPLDASSVTANLGIYLARDTGKSVLIIDSNLGSPSLSNIFGINGNPDIVDVFEGKCTLDDAIKDLGNNLYLLPSRSVQFRPIKLIDSPFMADLIRTMKGRYDFIFVDCQANLLNDANPLILSSYVDAVMMVLSEREDRYYQVRLAINILKQRNNVKIFSVLNNRKKDLPKILQKIT